MFVISSEGELVALGRDNGVIRWVTQLPRYKDAKDRKGTIFWTGPVLAGERLIVVSSDGRMAEIDPTDGEVIRKQEIDAPIRISPIVAGGTLYLLGEDGTLMAFR